jgi:DNA-binding CsgD family transcriptional regulator
VDSYQSGIDRVARICDRGGDLRSLRIALIEEIRRAVPFDAYAWLLTDPESEVGSAPIADVPCLPELPRLIRLKYLTLINRWTGLDAPVALLTTATGGELSESLVWSELLNDYAVTDVASAVFRDRFGCWAFLDLWRIGSSGAFTHAEAGFLEAVAPTVTSALRRAQAQTFRGDASSLMMRGPIVLMLSPELEVKGQTPETTHYLRLLVPPDGDRAPIPAAAYNVAAQLLSLEEGVDHHPAMTRVHLGEGIWLTLRGARIDVDSSSDSSDIAVTIERTSPGERLRVFSLACGLTPRERDVLQHLVTGADTRAVAKRMFVSEHTVQDHLKSIFTKTVTRSRAELLMTATGAHADRV